MPLDGFRILDWSSRTFGGLPPAILGGLGVALLIAGVVIAVVGVKMTPVSWSLLAAGLAMVVITYFVVGSAITGVAGGTLRGGEQVAGAAPRIVPAAVATTLFGLSLFGGRTALRFWSGEEASGKVMAMFLVVVMLGGIFVGVQVVRGSQGATAEPIVHAPESHPPADEPIRRGYVPPGRR